jgi:rRNA maturation endonuclease Nob1
MVVVDAIGTMFAAAVGGQGMVGHAQLVTAVYTMQRIATQHNVAFVVCNHTTGVKQNVS